MVDTILMCEGETTAQFELAIAVDEKLPMAAAWDVMTPVPMHIISGTAETETRTGWLFRVRQRNVQLTRILPVRTESDDQSSRCVVRLIETEGASRMINLDCFRTPTAATKLDFRGETIGQCKIESDAVQIQMDGFEICDLELKFD